MSEKRLICYASPKGYGKTYYELEKLQQENSQLKERIEKAIEYIEIEGEHTDCSGESIYYLDEEQEEDLLKILKGDKE